VYLGGKRTLAYFNAGVAVETKSDNTPVTRADKEAEIVIRERIAQAFPDHSFLGEEGGTTEGDPDYKWIIDPIDGTKSFIHGVPLYGVMVGLEIQGVSQVGAIYFPPLGEMICAATGLGCFWNGRPANVSAVSSLRDATLLSSSITTCTRRSDAFARLDKQVGLTRTWGDSFGYFLVATGRAEIMLDPKISPWDCAPLLPILTEAGGHFSDWDGNATIWGPDAAGTNHNLHDVVMEILQTEVPTTN
jgi:histidinol phosphatase-like enzyme (inositol monophosphatase family)